MVNSLFIFQKSATSSAALFGKDLESVSNSANNAVVLTFNTEDDSSQNVVTLACAAGDAVALAEAIAKDAHREGVWVYDDINSEYAQKACTGVTTITLNGTPTAGLYATQNVINVATATRTLTDAEAGSLIVIDKDGCAITMPDCDAAAVGQRYDFAVGTSQTSTNVITVTLDSGDLYKGVVTISATTDGIFAADASDDAILTLSATTTGGLAGGVFSLIYGEAGVVFITGALSGTGTAATPFS